MLRVFEAFAGVGSQRMALRNIGIEHEVVAIAEIDEHALNSYAAIHGDCPNLGDISKLTLDEIPDHDLFTYSFPCQDISISGNRNGLSEGSGTRSSLLWECRRVIEGKRPKYLLLENVKNLVGKKNKPDFDKWLEWLESQGYTNYWKVVNAKYHNIPQNRERVFVVSILGEHEEYTFPTEQPVGKLENILVDFDEKYFINKPFTLNGKTTGCVARLDEGGFDQGRRIYSSDYVSPTLTTRGNGGREVKVLVNGRVKAISPRESWKLMGFTDEDFNKAAQVNSDSQLYKQAGNSIVVNVLEGIFENLLS